MLLTAQKPRARRNNFAVAPLSFLALVLVVPIVFFGLTTGDWVYFPFVWSRGSVGPEAFLMLALTSLGLVQAAHSRHFSMLRIPFFVFMYTFFCLIPCYQIYLDSVPSFITIALHREDYENGLLLSSVALICYMFGTFVGSRQPIKTQTRLPPQANLQILCAVCVFLAVFSVALQLVWFGGDLSSFFVDRIQHSQRFEGDGSLVIRLVVTSLIRVPSFIAVALLWSIYFEHRSARSSKLFVAATFVCVPLFVLCNFPTAIPRLWLGGMMICLLVIYFKHSKFVAGVRFASVLLFAVLIAFPISGLMRRFFSVQTTGRETDYYQVILSSYTEGQFDAFQMLLSIMRYVDTFGLTYGWQSLSAFLFWVPRQFFPSKGVSTGTFVGGGDEFLFSEYLRATCWRDVHRFRHFGRDRWNGCLRFLEL